MSTDGHLVVYAAPAHASLPTVECSCGWSVIGERSAGRTHHEVLKELLDSWMSHIAEASAVSF